MKITVTGRQMTVRDSLREMVEKKLTVQVAAISESAKAKIEAAGGKAEVI